VNVFLIEDLLSTATGGVAVRAAGAQRRHREAAAEEPILLRGKQMTRVRSTLRLAAKLEVPPALHRRAGSRHARKTRDEPLPDLVEAIGSPGKC
jgi:hypothetical protein